ncbi:hypothetical protein QFZ43_008681 [Streptomyces afghaniensis]|nr:MMPL family transporter [Streptomyces afghaniensis]MDQ1022132.1 hypothetical protein [Streptomyces afghaniensis]
MPGTESQQAFDLLDERFPPTNSQGAEARLVLQAPYGQRVTARQNKAAVEGALGSLDGGRSGRVDHRPFGHRAWWPPRILSRVLPNVDIEGEALSMRVPVSATAPDAAVRRFPVGRD